MSWKIFVVDDDAPLREALGAVVRLVYRRLAPYADVEPVLLADGVEAVEFCREVAPDLVIMDVRMPGLDGIDTFFRMCEQHTEKPPRTVFLTGYAGRGDVRRRLDEAVSAGALGYLSKPVTSGELESFIRHHGLIPPTGTEAEGVAAPEVGAAD